MGYDEWIQIGLDAGWCGPAVCETHDGLPMSDEEHDQMYEGDEPCIHIIRLYPDAETRQAVELAHSPSNWRRPR